MSEAQPPICDYEGSSYQESFWEQGGREYEDRTEAIALKRLLPRDGTRLLEVGAGAGRNTPRYNSFEQIVLLDYSRTQLEKAQARLGLDERYVYVAGDAYRLPFAPSSFDAATMIRTLHHLVDPQRALRQVREALTPGGDFILEFASKRHLKAILRWVLRRQSWNPFAGETVEIVDLNFNFHPRQIQRWLLEAGFDLERQLTVSHFRLDWMKRRVPLGVLVGLDALAQWTGGLWQLTPSVFIRARAVGERAAPREGSIWRCPVCGSLDMEASGKGQACRGCGRVWGLQDGIYDFREPLT